MDTKEQIEQFKLAAELLETGHPWEWSADTSVAWFKARSETSVQNIIANKYRIRPALIQPPEGFKLHNPNKITAQQVGVGFRLCVPEELDGRLRLIAEYWSSTCKPNWCTCLKASITAAGNQDITFRVPASIPWPTIPEPDPFTAIKAGILAGKRYEIVNMDGTWSEWLGGLDFGLRKAAEFREMKEKIRVPLEVVEVPPGSVFRKPNLADDWNAALSVYSGGVYFLDSVKFSRSFKELETSWQINRSLSQGKWNPDAWEPCWKEADI